MWIRSAGVSHRSNKLNAVSQPRTARPIPVGILCSAAMLPHRRHQVALVSGKRGLSNSFGQAGFPHRRNAATMSEKPEAVARNELTFFLKAASLFFFV